MSPTSFLRKLLGGKQEGLDKRTLRLISLCDALLAEPAEFTGTANNHLLVSIARAFGVAIDSFGAQPNAADKNGPLAGLT